MLSMVYFPAPSGAAAIALAGAACDSQSKLSKNYFSRGGHHDEAHHLPIITGHLLGDLRARAGATVARRSQGLRCAVRRSDERQGHSAPAHALPSEVRGL